MGKARLRGKKAGTLVALSLACPAVPAAVATVATLLQIFTCMQCCSTFTTNAGISRHYQATGHDGQFSEPLPPRLKKRHRYSYREKRDILMDLDRVRNDVTHPHRYRATKYIAAQLGISDTSISRWKTKEVEIFAKARTRKYGNKKSISEINPRWPECEYKLYAAFLIRRRIRGRRTTYAWLRRRFLDIRRRAGHELPATYFPSRGWCSRFCKRWEITYQCRTNKHKIPIEQRIPAIQAFHQHWIYGVQRSYPQRDQKYGRFPRSQVYHMDQVPFAFAGGDKRTLNEKGAPKGCWTVGASDDDKRFLTCQVCICGDPADQDCKLELIFRNPKDGEYLAQEEHDYYDTLPGIKIRWQKKAWADSQVMLDWLVDFRGSTLHKGEVALLMDNHGSQRMDEFTTLANMLNIHPIYTPANCTDCVSPVDRNVGAWLKQRAYALQDEELEDNDEWCKEDGLSVSQKRKLCAKWLAQAWHELKTVHPHLLDSAFVDTGVCIAADGSENHKIRLRPKDELGQYDF
jgi:hypothetical protein